MIEASEKYQRSAMSYRQSGDRNAAESIYISKRFLSPFEVTNDTKQQKSYTHPWEFGRINNQYIKSINK